MLVATTRKVVKKAQPPKVSFHPALSWLSKFSDAIRIKLERWIINLSTEDEFKCQKTLKELQSELRNVHAEGYSCPEMVDALELVYVSLLGHHVDLIRDAAVVDLNVLYDGHNLQASEPLPVTIAQAGKSALVSIHMSRTHSHDQLDTSLVDRVVLRMFGPDPNKVNYSSSWKEYPVTLSKNSVICCELPPFSVPGFYDWIVAEPGAIVPAHMEHFPIESVRKLRGRFIVHPEGARQSVILEMPVDEVGAVWDETTGQLRTRGSFESVHRNMLEAKTEGVTAVYLMGALSRPRDDPDSSPFAVVDRQRPATVLGGETQFERLVGEIRRLGMTPIVDAVDRVSRNRMHRKYKKLTLETVNNKGIPVQHPGTDGRQNQWEDTALLNYRNVETWTMFLSEIHSMATKYGVRGIRLDNGQSCPPIMTPDMDELLRRDTDWQPHYSLTDIFFGSVVKASEEHGYWSSDACVERNYPNPFIVKMCKDLWNVYPDFLIIAESHFHRENSLLVSGAIAHSVRIPQILASISGNSLRRDGAVVKLPENKRSTSRTLSRLYRNDNVWLPKNPIMVNCTCTHASPYPGVLYGRRAWLAVDMLVLLPDVPMILYGEERGRAYRMNMTTVSSQEQVSDYDVLFDSILPKSPTKKSGHTSPADLGLSALNLGSSARGGLAALRGRGGLDRRPPTTPPVPAVAVGAKPRLRRRGSLADLRRVPSNSSMVRSRSRDDMKGLSVRSIPKEELLKLTHREHRTREEIGPTSGFDLAQINRHYVHRKLLRQEFEALRKGSMCVLTVDPQLKEQVFAFARYTENEIMVIAANFKDSRDGERYSGGCDIDLDLRPLWDHLPECYTREESARMYYKVVDTLTNADNSDVSTLEELVFRKYHFHINPLGTAILSLKKVRTTPDIEAAHFKDCLHRLEAEGSSGMKDPRENHLVAKIARGAASSVSDFASAVNALRVGLRNDGCAEHTVKYILQLAIQRASQLLFLVSYEGVPTPRDFDPPVAEKIVAFLTHMSTAAKDEELLQVTRSLISQTTKLGPLVFLTAEFGRFSTAGGLGVMVDELTKGLAAFGLDVYVISPYYTVNRKHQTGYLGDGIQWTRNVNVDLGTHTVECGVFEGRENDVNLIFLERGDYFPKLYSDPGNAAKHLQTVVLMSLGSLEICCAKGLVPSLVVSNDWLPSMAPAYRDFFGSYYHGTTFFHLIHNLGGGAYEGRCYPNPAEGTLGHIHRLPEHDIVNPWWSNTVVNPSRCALIRCNSWGTVSPSYLQELLSGHPLSDVLQIAKSPFAYPNGIRQADREHALREKAGFSHEDAKENLQKKYFGFENGDPSIPLFAFVGRITSQKGVHMILNAVEELVAHTGGKIQILVGGPANYSDEYSSGCARHMHDLRRRFPWSFWANPDEFFLDGPASNLGADFGLMPSLFEPGGIVQQEFFVAGTPVVAYKTGGLKDTVHEWKSEEGEGNGFTFENYSHGDFLWSVKRALRVFSQPEEYEELRASAYETTIDVTQVAWAWSSEFHRLRNAMYTKGELVSALIMDTVEETSDLYDERASPVDITWNGGGKSVTMMGSFDNWNAEWSLLPNIANDLTGDLKSVETFKTTLLLKPGEYMYKFKVDNQWVIAEDQPKKGDSAGFVNNVLKIS